MVEVGPDIKTARYFQIVSKEHFMLRINAVVKTKQDQGDRAAEAGEVPQNSISGSSQLPSQAFRRRLALPSQRQYLARLLCQRHSPSKNKNFFRPS